ncbi:DUF7793 family protein [Chryseosolibacter indicus]|uniref:DUF7793 domain-containing protein n=1 Tax=Chryseosolibacter indicus TaxID=2782351 RepID=A0ABS5VRI7_9BACT|nr:hypothetical protein [Chryseosolibacter indicus]MBT1703956.1 hypothetical protein [Chryseosolibacter indicus]
MTRRDYQQFETTSFWKEDDDDIVFWNYKPGLEIDIAIAKELVRHRLEYTQGQSVYTLIDFTHVKSVTKEARDYMNSEEGGLKGVLGGAFLSNSIVSTLFINLYIKISSPTVPAKFFTDRGEAISWLKKIKAKQELHMQ